MPTNCDIINFKSNSNTIKDKDPLKMIWSRDAWSQWAYIAFLLSIDSICFFLPIALDSHTYPEFSLPLCLLGKVAWVILLTLRFFFQFLEYVGLNRSIRTIKRQAPNQKSFRFPLCSKQKHMYLYSELIFLIMCL